MKKTYKKPSMRIYYLEPSRIICSSDNWGYMPNTPTIPGQPEDGNHLA